MRPPCLGLNVLGARVVNMDFNMKMFINRQFVINASGYFPCNGKLIVQNWEFANMETSKVPFCIVLLYLHLEVASACDILVTGQPTLAYRCVANSGAQVGLIEAKFPQCVWRCTGKKICRYINHNSATDQCELGLGQCDSVEADVGFMVMAFGPPRQVCLQWGSSNEHGRVPVQVEVTVQRANYIYVARIIYGDNVLLGKFKVGHGKYYANNEGAAIGPILETDQEIESLTKDVTCTVPWMAYTAGETLPDGAVAWGRIADGSPTYVAMITHTGQHLIFGYYNPKMKLAYYEAAGPYTTISMDILVVIWIVI